jgi:hypothetical protein
MAVTASNAVSAIPVNADDSYIVGNASGTALIVNPGDWVGFSGNYIVSMEDAQAYFKVSGAGIAVDRNPAYDWAGRQVINSALLISRHPIMRVSASFSGQPLLGVHVYPVTTGSGVNAASGVTGVAATWNTAAPVRISANPTGAPSLAVGQMIASYPALGLGGTGQMDIVIWPPRSDYY